MTFRNSLNAPKDNGFLKNEKTNFFQQKVTFVSFHNIIRKGCVGVTWLSRPSDLRKELEPDPGLCCKNITLITKKFGH